MSEERKVVMGEAYKEALEQKKSDSLRQRARELANESAQKQRVVTAKKKLISKKQEIILKKKRNEVMHYKAELEKAEKRAHDSFSSILALCLLMLFILLLLLDFALYKRGSNPGTVIAILVFAIISLFASIFIQASILEAENRARDYIPKLRIAEQELENLLSRYRH